MSTVSVRWKINQSVGRDQSNSHNDVRQVISLLNMIGQEFGGTFEFPLPVSGMYTPQLGRAILDFQASNLNVLLMPKSKQGCVFPDSPTLKRMNELAGSFGFERNSSLHPVRQSILRIARAEIGIVSDNGYAEQSELMAYNSRFGSEYVWSKNVYRKGMARLREYFTGTTNPPMDWKKMGKYTSKLGGVDRDYDLSNEDGVVKRNRRPPLGVTETPYYKNGKKTGDGYYNGFHWCGVFAAWVLQQAGIKGIQWKFYYGLNATKAKDYSPSTHPPGTLMYTDVNGPNTRKKIASGQIPLRPGDVLVLMGGNNHHVILTDYHIKNAQMFSGPDQHGRRQLGLPGKLRR